MGLVFKGDKYGWGMGVSPLFPRLWEAMTLTLQTRFANKAEDREVCIFDSPRIAFYTLFLLLSYDTKECRHLTT